jgi:hypothetical protein
MATAKNIIPSALSANSQGYVQDDGITYNQAGLSYNAIGIHYGGFYGFAAIFPSFASILTPTLTAIINKTQQYLADQGITYNEAGITYNTTGYMYGGVYGYNDVVPMFANAAAPKPSIYNYADIYTPGPPVGQTGIPLGPGFFMFITQ